MNKPRPTSKQARNFNPKPFWRHYVAAATADDTSWQSEQKGGRAGRFFMFLLLFHAFLIGAAVLFNLVAERPKPQFVTSPTPSKSAPAPAKTPFRSSPPQAAQSAPAAPIPAAEPPKPVAEARPTQPAAPVVAAVSPPEVNPLSENWFKAPTPAGPPVGETPKATTPLPKATPVVMPEDAPDQVTFSKTTEQPKSTPATPTRSAKETPTGRMHVVKPKETFFSISRRYGVSVNELMRINGYSDPGRLRQGITLRVPSK
ncbi:MAG: LysM peptidoglycan-binding domain-containing protein [Roseimicrobium sp.]